ncbi:cellular tumor antigen p53-like isoform X2 [Rhodnius prolixus]|uniref:Putative p53 dna-binding domain protein panstrongylus lignarius n=1 Tax=Rhodnius prolixus TaxID=13249 RepID=A0A4P6D6P8_RHOPR
MEIKCDYDQKCDSTQRNETFAIPLMNSDDVPSLEEFTGIYNFSVHVTENNGGSGLIKSSFGYSSLLNQVFINIHKLLMVNFNLNHIEGYEQGLYIRAMPVYTCTDYIREPVERCDMHFMEDDPDRKAHQGNVCRCPNFNNAGHIVRAHSSGTMYSYDPQSKRHSVIVPLSKLPAGSRSFTVLYSFACKTSCPKGMQRRPVKVLFTLETSSGNVMGRCTMSVKICSCPKRDKDRMERDLLKDNRTVCMLQVEEDPLSNKEEIIEKLRKELRELKEKIKSIEQTVDLLETL